MTCPSDVVKEHASYSKLACFLDCRRQFWFRYVEKIVPLRWTDAMNEGTIFHELMENITKYGYNKAVEMLKSQEHDPIMVIKAEEAAVALLNSPGWVPVKINESEVSFDMPIKIGGKPIIVRGKVDGVGTYYGTPCAFEFKRVSSISTRTLENVEVNNQSLFYRMALNYLDKPVESVVYVFVSMPKATPAQAVPKELLRLKKDGEPYAGQQLEDETIDEFRTRVKKWYADHPNAIQVYVDQRSKHSLVDFAKWLNDVVKDMRRAIKENKFYLNSNACRMRSCAYRSVCMTDCPEVREMNYATAQVSQPSAESVEVMEF